MRVLVTGGAGYIGSHTTVLLLEAGHEVHILDNLCNSSPAMVERVGRVAGRKPEFLRVDLCDRSAVAAALAPRVPDAVLHFAGLKAVGESVQNPLGYYQNNLHGTLNLLEVLDELGTRSFVFSSSATVYGDPAELPITEGAVVHPTNPYGRTKLMIEEILADLALAKPAWRIACLRYFNPVGAHPSGLIGENPRGVPNNLAPYIAQVASGKRARLQIFGADYPTADGTGVRDYIHVMDLAAGHLAALDYLQRQFGSITVNLGTGRGYSVLELVRAFERACGRVIPYEIVARRPGDIASCFADATLARDTLRWEAKRTLEDMCADAWRWQSLNPHGVD
ncbi:MAG: UDP-glucose 4-epimerase GalE [Betaproteobacteria bacterium]|nr:UDP-glucose 4-epimerase GalE [Betaproteobacteria bacterium]